MKKLIHKSAKRRRLEKGMERLQKFVHTEQGRSIQPNFSLVAKVERVLDELGSFLHESRFDK